MRHELSFMSGVEEVLTNKSIISKVKLATVVEGDQKAPFPIATKLQRGMTSPMSVLDMTLNDLMVRFQ